MFLPLLLPALITIGISTFIIRIVIGYLVRPIRSRRRLFRFPGINTHWIGRQLAVLLYQSRFRTKR